MRWYAPELKKILSLVRHSKGRRQGAGQESNDNISTTTEQEQEQQQQQQQQQQLQQEQQQIQQVQPDVNSETGLESIVEE